VESGEGIESAISRASSVLGSTAMWNPVKELKEIYNSGCGKASRFKVESGEGIERMSALTTYRRWPQVESGEGIER